MAKKQRAALICRVSTPQQIKLGLESQVAVLKRQAIKDGYEVPNELIFQEQISGLDAKKPIRKSLQDLMDAVDENKVDVCYTYELTRISRDPYNLVERVKWFTDRHIPMYIYDAEMWTLDRKTKEEIEETTEYVFSAATYGKVEAKKIKQRMTRARNEVAKEGLYVGHLSDGYCVVETERGKEIKVDEDRREVIQTIFDLYTQGNTIDRIAEHLNANNIPTASNYRLKSPKFKGYQETYHRKGSDVPINRKDIRWQGATVSNYLRNRWYIGERTYNKQKYSIDPIIKTEQWNVASAMLEKNAISFRSKKESSKHQYILSGLLYCGKCGKRMYGHHTGLNNHYYCSSVEEGVKCGLIGVNKENIEALIVLAIKSKATLDLLDGTKGLELIADYFKMDEKEKKNLKGRQKDNERQINELNKRIDKKNDEIDDALKQSIIDKQRASSYVKIAQDFEKERDSLIRDREKLTSENIIISKKLKTEVNLSKRFNRMIDEKDLSMLKELIRTVTERIWVYNLSASIDVIRIKYTNGDVDDFIYSYRLLKQGFIPLHHAIFNEIDLIYYDEKDNSLKSKKEGVLFERMYLSNEQLQEAFEEASVEEIARFVSSTDVMWLEETVDAKEFVEYCLHSKGVPYFERLEELTDRAKEQYAKDKEWRKKYNTGLPKCVPYVVKDEAYKEISLKKKHLYNRKYKIKKHKKLTDDEKKKRLAEIDKELALLSAKVKYLNREEAVKEYQKQKSNR